MFISESQIIVRYAETDQMGIVHHSNYPIWYEVGRTDFIKQLGTPYSKIEENGILLPLIELKCNYKGAAHYEDELVIKTKISELTLSRLTFHYEVFLKAKMELINYGYTMHVFTNKDLRPVNIKKAAPEIYKILNEAAG